MPVGMVRGVPLGDVRAHGFGESGVCGVQVDLDKVPAWGWVGRQLVTDEHEPVVRLHDGIVERAKVPSV